MRVAVYAIGLNEKHNLKDWYKSAKEADVVLYADTGSNDGSLALAKKLGMQTASMTVKPWRFDVAKNTALNLLPGDIDVVVSMDLDERLLPGWRKELESTWIEGATILNHKYRNNGRPWQWHSKIHARHGCHWKGAVHEELFWNIEEKALWNDNIFLDEVQDLDKDRSGYLQLLEKKVSEGDRTWRTLYFLANEYESVGETARAADTRSQSFLACDESEVVVRSYICRNIARNYATLGEFAQATEWFERGIAISPERETWFYYAQMLYSLEDWEKCLRTVRHCLAVNTRRDGFTYDELAWGMLAYDYAALAAWYTGDKQSAAVYGIQALEFEPENERLLKNLEFYTNGA